MSKFKEKTKNFLYDSTDYILIIGIIVVVSGVIAWRLDILFNDNNVLANKTKTTVTSDKDIDNKDKKSDEDNDNAVTVKSKSKKVVSLTIPERSSTESIGNILLENKLIEDVSAFIAKTTELNLASSLKPGDYKFMEDEKVADILATISQGPNASTFSEEDTSSEGTSNDNTDTTKEKSKDTKKKNDKKSSKKDESKTKMITVDIPNGTPAKEIGNILKQKGLISDVNEFVSVAESTGLDVYLRPGSYEIKEGETLDNVIKTVANRF